MLLVSWLIYTWNGKPFQDPKADSAILALLNDYRERAGVAPVYENRKLNRMGQWQADFGFDDGQISHTHTNSWGFTSTLNTRSLAAGYLQDSMEVIGLSQVSNDPTEPVVELLDAPYHRLAMLCPNVKEAGVGYRSLNPHDQRGGTVAIQLGEEVIPGLQPKTQAAYPYPGQTEVPLGYVPQTEIPAIPAKAALVGYPVSFELGAFQKLQVKQFSLKNEATGELVPGAVLTAKNDPNMPEWGTVFVPGQPLDFSTRYTASIDADSTQGAIRKSWSFTTKPAPPDTFSLKLSHVDKEKNIFYFDVVNPRPTEINLWAYSSNNTLIDPAKALNSTGKLAVPVYSCTGDYKTPCVLMLYFKGKVSNQYTQTHPTAMRFTEKNGHISDYKLEPYTQDEVEDVFQKRQYPGIPLE